MEVNCVNCKFSHQKWNYIDDNKHVYTCTIEEAAITEPETKITFLGNHLRGRSNDNVIMIVAENTTVHYLPRDLHKTFPNLRALVITNCDLKSISRKDLMGLENLEDLNIQKNKLRSLPSDLFTGMTKLKEISFRKNELEFMSSDLIKPIAGNGLTYVDFEANTKINAFFSPTAKKTVNSLQALMDLIDKNCVQIRDRETENFAYNFANVLKELWTSKDYADFTIVVDGGDNGKVKEFTVHKNILATQSPVFDATFKNEMQERKTGKMFIKGFSAEIVEAMLKFMYTGEIQNTQNVIDIFAIATQYQVKLLLDATEAIIWRNIDDSNAYDILIFSHQHNSNALKHAAFNTIKKMFPEIKLREDLVDQPESLKELIDARLERLEVTEKFQQALKKFKAT